MPLASSRVDRLAASITVGGGLDGSPWPAGLHSGELPDHEESLPGPAGLLPRGSLPLVTAGHRSGGSPRSPQQGPAA